jgi:hypothetical protein
LALEEKAFALSVGEALAVLLRTWNSSYYRYQSKKIDMKAHYESIDVACDKHRDLLASCRKRALESLQGDEQQVIGGLFREFESVLGADRRSVYKLAGASAAAPMWRTAGTEHMPSRMLQRPLTDLIAALRRHVELLKVYAHHAFQEGNTVFLGEVAGKLRMLVAEHGRSQQPLLLDLMDEVGADVRFKLNLPPVQDPDYDKEITLRDYMGRTALGVATGSGFRMLSHSEFVREWANQYGTAHEAWRVTEHFLNAHDAGVYIGEEAANVATLRGITNIVLHVADRFLAEVTNEAVESAEQRRARTSR